VNKYFEHAKKASASSVLKTVTSGNEEYLKKITSERNSFDSIIFNSKNLYLDENKLIYEPDFIE
jgi:hypothetical protein